MLFGVDFKLVLVEMLGQIGIREVWMMGRRVRVRVMKIMVERMRVE